MSIIRKVVVPIAAIFTIGSISIEQMSAQTPISLDSCYRLATKQNKEIAVAKHEIEAARLKEKEVSVNFFPQATLYGGAFKFGDDLQPIDYDRIFGGFSPLIPNMIKERTKLDMSSVSFAAVNVIQPLFMGGKIVAAKNMAHEAIAIKEGGLQMKTRDTYASIDEAYWQVVALSSKLRLSKSYLKLLNDALKDVTVLYEQGIATKADVLSVKVKQSDAEVTLTKVENGLELSRMLLSQRLGLDPSIKLSLVDEEDGHLNSDTDLLPQKMDDLDIQSVIERRPEIKSLTAAEKVFKYNRKMVAADMLPHVALIGGYSLTNPNVWGDKVSHNLGGTYHVGVAVSVPLTGIVSGVFKYNGASEGLAIRKLETEDARNKINLQINQTRLNLEEAYKQLNTAIVNKQNADENLRYARVGYKEGVIPVINLTAAQTAWIQAGDALIDAHISLRLAQGKYERAVGIMPIAE